MRYRVHFLQSVPVKCLSFLPSWECRLQKPENNSSRFPPSSSSTEVPHTVRKSKEFTTYRQKKSNNYLLLRQKKTLAQKKCKVKVCFAKYQFLGEIRTRIGAEGVLDNEGVCCDPPFPPQLRITDTRNGRKEFGNSHTAAGKEK